MDGDNRCDDFITELITVEAKNLEVFLIRLKIFKWFSFVIEIRSH